MTEHSGPQWVARFPGSRSLVDLNEPFRSNVQNFIAEIERAGASVHVSSTYRPAERAYLMHWCCKIAGYRDKHGAFHRTDPADVPAMAGVDIDWTHEGDRGAVVHLAAARQAAQDMREAFGIVFPAALVSRHTQRNAIDMTIAWKGALRVVEPNGNIEVIDTSPRTGMNPELWDVGAIFGVHKLASDPPHWSTDGH